MSDSPQNQRDSNAPQRPRFLPVVMALCAAAFLAMLFEASQTKSPDVPKTTLVTQRAPDFSVARLEPEHQGERLELNALLERDQPVVLNFWASWCVGCVEEAADLERFWQNNRSRVQMIGIALQDKPKDALAFARQHEQSYPIGLDDNGGLGIDYGIMGLPETFIIDRRGIVRKRLVGAVTARQLEQEIDKIDEPNAS